MTGPCAKQVVRATIIDRNGSRHTGENSCANPQMTCPRGDLPSGVGYELCKSICHQGAHAEVNAIASAGPMAAGAVLYLEGHTHACDACRSACNDAGVRQIIIGSPPA